MPDDLCFFFLPKLPTILENEDFEKKKLKSTKRAKSKLFFDVFRPELESRENLNFIDILSSDIGWQTLRENMLPIHIETSNIFYDNYNTRESIHNFLLRQQ